MIDKNKKNKYTAEKAVIIGVITQQQSQDDVEEYLDELGHAPVCEVCGLPLYHVDIAKRIDVAA